MLYANESCEEHKFFSSDNGNDMLITLLLFDDDVISLESRPLIFMYLCMHTQSIQKKIVEYDIKSKYPEDY